jgi:preprotein translocase subunit SecG
MQLFITILHVMLSFGLIGIILLQPGKDGASVLGGGGGGGNQMYGPRGSANLLGRATTVVAALFMVTSITLAWLTGVRSTTGNDLDEAIEELESEDDLISIPGLNAPTPDPVAPTAPPATAGAAADPAAPATIDPTQAAPNGTDNGQPDEDTKTP